MNDAFLCFFLDADGKIAGRCDFLAHGDRAAIVKARALLSEHALQTFELWSGLLLVYTESADKAGVLVAAPSEGFLDGLCGKGRDECINGTGETEDREALTLEYATTR
jgi:hypothetical protein